MGESSGQAVYYARSQGALWSIACYVAGVALRDGIAAAREYADVNDLPWPPPTKQKSPGEFLGTRELREVIGRVFLPKGASLTLTPEQELEGYRLRMMNLSWVKIGQRIHCQYPEVIRDCVNEYAKRRGLPTPPANVLGAARRMRKGSNVRKDGPRLAYQIRLIEGLEWNEISARCGYKAYRNGQYSGRAARRFAEEEGLPWPVPSHKDLPSERDEGRAYFYRGTGLCWRAVALLSGYSHRGAQDAAQRHSVTHGLPWPIEVSRS